MGVGQGLRGGAKGNQGRHASTHHRVDCLKQPCHTENTMASTISAVKLGKQGRLVVPMPLRQELGLEAGDELVARVDDGRLIFEPRAAVIDRLRSRFAAVEGSMADELLRERRDEAKRESTL